MRKQALAVSGTVLAVLATIVHILAFSTQHWLESFEQAKSRFDRIGLWEACFNVFGYDRDQLGKQYDGCHWIYSYEYKPIFDWLNPRWFLSVQIIMTLALILNIVTALRLVVGICGKWLSHKMALSQFIVSMTMFLSGALIAVAVSVFGVKSKIDRQWFPRPDQNYLSWSFGLAVVSGFFAVFSAMCLLFDSLRIKYDDKKKALKERYKAYEMKTALPQY